VKQISGVALMLVRVRLVLCRRRGFA